MCDTYHGMYTAVPLYVKGDTLINPHGGPHRQLTLLLPNNPVWNGYLLRY